MGNKKKKTRYCILAYEGDIEKTLEEAEIETSPVYFMTVEQNTGLGKLIKEEAKRRVDKIKTSQN